MIRLSLLEIALRLGVALLLGALIGLERARGEHPRRAAGMRTLALVAMGSALLMIVSAYGFTDFTSDVYAKVDPSRIAAQVVSGIGFLGAGAILLRRSVVRGLTTAAAIWLVAGIGLASGIGMIVPSIIATGLGLIVLEALVPIEQRLLPRRSDHLLQLRLAAGAEPGHLLGKIYEILAGANVVLDTVELRPGRRGEIVELHCHTRDRGELVQAISGLRALPEVQAVRADLRGARQARARRRFGVRP